MTPPGWARLPALRLPPAPPPREDDFWTSRIGEGKNCEFQRLPQTRRPTLPNPSGGCRIPKRVATGIRWLHLAPYPLWGGRAHLPPKASTAACFISRATRGNTETDWKTCGAGFRDGSPRRLHALVSISPDTSMSLCLVAVSACRG